MDTSQQYQRDHLVGKLIVFVLYLVIGSVSIECEAPYVALVAGTAIWLFGVNTAAYLVESLVGHGHRHQRI